MRTVLAAFVLLYLTIGTAMFLVGVMTWVTANTEAQEEAGKEAIKWSPIWLYRLLRTIFPKE